MKRREFIKRASQATGLAAVCVGGGWFFHDREWFKYEPPIVHKPDFQIAPDNAYPQISLSRNQDHVLALRDALDAVGGIARFVRAGERVTVKPNVGWDRTAAQAANTSPVLVGEMVRQCLDAGAAEVIVTDVTCNEARRCFLRSGIKEAAEKAGAKVILAVEDDYLVMDLKGRLLTSWPVLRHFVETDRLINMPIVKHHSLSMCTVGMKNLYGILGGRRNQLHQEIDQSIVDLAMFSRPTLTVVDATRVLMRGGPQGGSLDDVNIEHSVICATDQVAADARAVEFLGLAAADVAHIVQAEKAGLGLIDYRAAGYKENLG
ncbi:MAG: DUF362 domain-containing protein [candidate division Zixibacteria bacterium]|nr:DUF362 domain-containing protein [candidate division Zixibacteria bacterium]MDH3937379.1 DUF362 domain-containing protein [candidate division Zixibacteria bacterium]MDH4033249.1 DUF362 domain-containing protein [candidate division Zixibacteria bacterium]